MARAEFQCAECGKDVPVVGRNRADADRLAAWHAKQGHICADCEAKHRAEENAKAAEANAQAGLPALSGSDKQVSWAETIRATMLADLQGLRPLVLIATKAIAANDDLDEAEQQIRTIINTLDGRARNLYPHWTAELAHEITTIERLDALQAVISKQQKAAWWIDHRDVRFDRIAASMRDAIDAEFQVETTSPEVSQMAAEAAESAIIRPVGQLKSEIVTEVRLVGKTIKVSFPAKREDFRNTVKALGFTWNGLDAWTRTLDFRAGEPEDRVAEVGHRLVAAGFAVVIHDETARAPAIDGSFKPEQTRWITKGSVAPYDGWSKITWRRPDDLYEAARSLPGARYKDGAVFVPPGAIEAVFEFSQRYGFSMSESPLALLEAHRAALAGGAVITDIKDRPVSVTTSAAGKPQRLEVPDFVEVDDDLKDA